MRWGLIFSIACAVNVALFWAMVQMLTVEQSKKWIRSTDAQFFDFIRQRPRPDTIPRTARKSPPKPESQTVSDKTLSSSMSQQHQSMEALRALPLPVPALKVEVPLNARLNIGRGPALPPVVSSGQSKTGALGSVGGSYGRGLSGPAYIMADELVAISRMQPAYPEKLRFRRIEGQVLVEFTVTPEGKVADPLVISGTPAGAFDRTVLKAIRYWRFQPKRDEQGKPQAVRVRQNFVFQLNR